MEVVESNDPLDRETLLACRVSEELVWNAPLWSSAPRQWWVLRKYILSRGPILRIIGGSYVAIGVTVLGFKLMLPQLILPNIWPMLLMPPAIIGAMVFQSAILAMFKKRILVKPNKIVIYHGQSALIIRSNALITATLIVHDGQRIRLRLGYNRNGRQRVATVGLSEDCDLKRLSRLLPVQLEARDARRSRTHWPDASSTVNRSAERSVEYGFGDDAKSFFKPSRKIK